ncbi:hypothetical protein BV22DRAFT_1020459, partial [Leucogyrophana mollusca]
VVGLLDVCVCVSDVPTFVEKNDIAKEAVKLVGSSKVEVIVKNLIDDTPGQECHYPDHAQATCTSANPCAFECTDGFLPYPRGKPTKCICPPHLTECNGKCGHFPIDCATKAPVSHRRRNTPTCHPGLELCGIPNGSDGKGWKCVNVQTDAQTCGGCVAPPPFGNPSTHGINCMALPHVTNATCSHGQCVITGCDSGYFFSPTRNGCIPIHDSSDKDATNPNAHEAGAGILGAGVPRGFPAYPQLPHDELAATIAQATKADTVGPVIPPILAFVEDSTVPAKISRPEARKAVKVSRSVGYGAVSGAGADVNPELSAMEVANPAEKVTRDIDG